MQFFYGNYLHQPNSVSITSWRRQYSDGQTGRHNYLRINGDFRGKLIGTSQSDIMAKLLEMQNAYIVGGQSAGFYDNSGVVIPAFLLDTNLAIGGVFVTNPISHEKVEGAQGVTYLYYTFSLQADFFAPKALLSFKEKLSFRDNFGNGLKIERIPVQGYPIQQQVTERSWFFATQSGSLTQQSPNPQPMAPIWPNSLRGTPESRLFEEDSPEMIRGIPVKFGVNWKYEFIQNVPFIGSVNALG